MTRSSSTFLLFLLLLFSCLCSSVEAIEILSLTNSWKLISSDQQLSVPATVPGDVYSDLYHNKVIQDPLYGDNSIIYANISMLNWIYQTEFSMNKSSIFNKKTKILRFEGLDTVATVSLNDEIILESDNMFISYDVNVNNILKNHNRLKILFKSPVIYSQNQSIKYQNEYGHVVPPACPPDVIHGQCHVNMIRKAQYSFGWDWGPSIPTMGIWKPIQMIGFDEATVDDVSWTTQRMEDTWNIQGELDYLVPRDPFTDHCHVSIDDVIKSKIRIHLPSNDNQITAKVPFQLLVPRSKVVEWWPNGEGAQKLYNFTVKCQFSEITKKIGFRHIELIQSIIDPNDVTKGNNFYFKVNDRPVFLKGSNWIPTSMFLSNTTKNNYKMRFLIDSAVEVGMNTLRVWGGGVYESEDFYDYANEKGILIWQDLMFACALYPINKEFLSNIRQEIEQQVWRLRKHVSILLYAGDNELETAIRGHWWSVSGFPESDQVRDYLKIRREVISPMVELIDSTRSFVSSSPGNGLAGESATNISGNPQDERYGDIHFYNEFINQWEDSNYPTPRCATEYGVQSMPLRSTMFKYIDESEWKYWSSSMSHRQHHRAGILTNLFLVFSHFPMGKDCSTSIKDLKKCESTHKSGFIDRFAYFSQAHQAITYKVQTEHYRRYRNRLTSDGKGNTMCALYWQLNDVWAAPSWSSIDVDLNWKLVHYYVRHFFDKITVSLYITDIKSLGITIINDSPQPLPRHRLTIYQYVMSNKFQPIYKQLINVDVPALSSKEFQLEKMIKVSDAFNNYVFVAKLKDKNGNQIGETTVLLPDKLFMMDFNSIGNVSIANFEKENDTTYNMEIHASAISPLTWISVNKHFEGWFSDNAFTMTEKRKQIKLKLRTPMNITKEDIIVCNLRNCEK